MDKQEVDSAMSKFFFATGTPFHVVENPYFKELMSKVCAIELAHTACLQVHACIMQVAFMRICRHARAHTRTHTHTHTLSEADVSSSSEEEGE